MLIYFAGPLFSMAERSFNLRLANHLEEAGYEVFLPQRDGAEILRLQLDERRRAIFEAERDKILEADVFLFVLDGRVPDEGAAVELGMAYAQRHLEHHRKLLLGFHSDIRGAFHGSKLNPMLLGPLERIVGNEEELLEALELHRSKIR